MVQDEKWKHREILIAYDWPRMLSTLNCLKGCEGEIQSVQCECIINVHIEEVLKVWRGETKFC